MKNKLKSTKRSSKTAAGSQSKTAQGKTRLAPVRIDACVWYLEDGSKWARVDFPWDVFVLIKRAARELNITLQQFFDNAIHDYIMGGNFAKLRKIGRAS
jgi:predicted nucleic-acid-binding protein